MPICINCGTETDTPYCPECGQKMEVSKIKFKTIIEDFSSKWIGLDNKFGRTFKTLWIRPEKALNAYLDGNRVRYLGPLGYLVVLSALMIICFDLLGLEVSDFLLESGKVVTSSDISEEQMARQRKINEFVAQYFRFLSAAIIPFFAVTIGWFFRSRKFNFTQRMVIATYISSQSFWTTIVTIIVFAISGVLYQFIGMAISIAYYAYGFHRFYKSKNVAITILKTLGAYIASFILLMIFAGLIGVIIGLLGFK